MPEINESQVKVVRESNLATTDETAGMDRRTAFETENALFLRLRIEEEEVSGWHHHGDHHVFGYLEEGRGRWEYGDSKDDAVILEEGDFWHIPPRTIHRDINPVDGLQSAVVTMVGSGPMAIEVDSPNDEPTLK